MTTRNTTDATARAWERIRSALDAAAAPPAPTPWSGDSPNRPAIEGDGRRTATVLSTVHSICEKAGHTVDRATIAALEVHLPAWLAEQGFAELTERLTRQVAQAARTAEQRASGR